MALTGTVGAVWRNDGNPSVAFTDEATSKNGAYTVYWITNASKKYWDNSYPVTVKKNGTIITSGFNLDLAGGVINFSPALLVTDVITVSGKYFNMIQCSTFFNWKMDIQADAKECTTFASNGWKEYLNVLNGWSASAEGYWADGSFLSLLGTQVCLVLYVDDTSNKRYEGYIMLKKNSISEPVDDIVKETVDFEGSGELCYHEN